MSDEAAETLTVADIRTAMEKLLQQPYRPTPHEQFGAHGRCLTCGVRHV